MTENLLETASQARERDRYTIETEHIPSLVLMENAARSLCRLLQTRLLPDSRVLILCGPGNNGQDGLAMLRILREQGVDACAFSQSDSSQQQQILSARGIEPVTNPEQALRQMSALSRDDWIVDAMFGSGLSRPLTGLWEQLAQAADSSRARILSVDVPSGIHGTLGPLSAAVIHADLTGALQTQKVGTILPASLPCTGETRILDIGLGNPGTDRDTFLLTETVACQALPGRSALSYKGTFGKALMIGGCKTMHGAMEMSAKACFHSGIGLLTVAVPPVLQPPLRCVLPEAMLLDLHSDPDFLSEEAIPEILKATAEMSVVSAGNGLSRTPSSRELVRSLMLNTECTLVLDADALSLLDLTWLKARQGQTILTPHPGEFSRMTGISPQELQKDPVTAARAFSRQYPGTVLVLKGDITCVSCDGQTWVLARPDSALAKGGSGDVLCGIITGLAGSQNPLQAALCGVWAHNQAAAISEKDPAAFSPQDLTGSLSTVWTKLRNSPGNSPLPNDGKHTV
ncbi:NAD(P)H-hydrate dehydratase [uncultured Faecalibaculum sp.]|uniref:NAD(P)H-hydrate dehydratase n=1 Tax=uncultured Faecalibaculum sp. TaxID=1729681 RepID=UPI002628B287|nr:NAD(P)H-hydrate dehydratase [uncultured Faecalibaculum sp.]